MTENQSIYLLINFFRLLGGLADKEGSLIAGDEILTVNDESVQSMTRTEAWNHLKKLPDGPVHLLVRRVDYGH